MDEACFSGMMSSSIRCSITECRAERGTLSVVGCGSSLWAGSLRNRIGCLSSSSCKVEEPRTPTCEKMLGVVDNLRGELEDGEDGASSRVGGVLGVCVVGRCIDE